MPLFDPSATPGDDPMGAPASGAGGGTVELWIELWRSATGIADDDFSLLQALPEPAGGFTAAAPFGFPDAPVVPYQLLIYKARRVTASGTASAFSPPVYARGPWPQSGRTFARNPDMSTVIQNTNIGLRSKMGFALEAIEGQPVKSQVLLDRAAGSPDMDLEQIKRKSLRSNTGYTGALAGKATVAGSGIAVEPCPESITPVLCAFLGTPVTTATPAVAGGAGPPAVAPVGAYYDHLFSETFDQFSGTMSERRGTSFFCHPGTRINGLDVKVDPDSAEQVMFTLETNHLNQLLYAQESDLGLDTAGFDTLLPPAAVDSLLKIAGSLSADAKTADLKLKRGLKARRGMNGTRGATSHYLGRSEHSATVGLHFSTEAELLRYFGQAQQAQQQIVYPYGATNTIQYVPLSLLLPMPLNAANFQNQIEIIFPAAAYQKVGQPVAGEDEIIQTIEIHPYIDPVANTSLQVRVRNSKTFAATVATGVPVVAVPLNSVTAYHTP